MTWKHYLVCKGHVVFEVLADIKYFQGVDSLHISLWVQDSRHKVSAMILLLLQFFEKKFHNMDIANNQGTYNIAVGIIDFGDITLL